MHIRTPCSKMYGSNTGIRCGQAGCFRFFDDSNSLRRHILRCHSFDSHEVNVTLAFETLQLVPAISSLDAPIPFTSHHNSNTSSLKSEEILNNQLAHMASLFNSDPAVTFKTAQMFFRELDVFVTDALNQALEHELKCLNVQGIEYQYLEKLVDRFSTTIRTCTNKFSTVHKRQKYFTDIGTFIPPHSIVIGNRIEVTHRGGDPTVVPSTAQLIPLRCVFQKLLSLPGLMNEMDHYILTCSQFPHLINFSQGQVWQNILANDNENVKKYPLFIFFDDFESGNPLGSHSGIHKLGAVYVALATIPPRLASRLKYIFLALLFHSSDRSRHGNLRVFQALIEELNFLSNVGVNIDTPDFKGIVKFELGALLGDNLGLHSMLGFVESFRANYPCRVCRASKEITSQQVYEDLTLLRNMENYQRDLATNNPSLTGIKEKSVWLLVHKFCLFQQVAVDCMHDLFEGVCGYSMTLIINGLLDRGYFTLEFLNRRISEFNYGYDNNSKPPILSWQSNSIHWKMSSSECMVFVNYFSILVGDKVRIDDNFYALYILLREIINSVMTDSVYSELCTILKHLIAEFNTLYMELSQRTLQPKFHHLVHYPNMMRKFGPLVHLWSMRYESKHRIAKTIARATAGRINICKTISTRMQFQLNDFFFHNFTSSTFEHSKLISPSKEEVTSLRTIFNLHSESVLYSVKYITYDSYTYRPNDVLCTGLNGQDFNYPVFVKVVGIYLVQDTRDTFIACTKFHTSYFDTHFQAYAVEATDNVTYLKLSLITFPCPNTLSYLSNNVIYITLRNSIA